MTGTEPPPTRPAAPPQRVFWQPHQWTFWAYIALLAASLPLWFSAFGPIGVLPLHVVLIAVAVIIALGVVLLLLIRALDLFRGAQPSLLAAAFLWGAVAAVGYAPTANDDLGELLPKVLGPDTGTAWSPALSAPTVEEALKTIGIILVVLIGRGHITRVSQAAVIGALCGLGFQLLEDLLYAIQTALTDPNSDLGGMLATVTVRTLGALDSHWLYSAMAGLAVGYVVVRTDRSRARRRRVATLLLLVALWMHVLSNSPIEGEAGVVAMVGKVAANLLLGLLIYRRAMRAEWRQFAATTSAELSEVITRAEVSRLRNHRTRRRAVHQARHDRGTAAVRTERYLQDAQLELANDMDRRDDETAEARRAYLRAVRATSSAAPQVPR